MLYSISDLKPGYYSAIRFLQCKTLSYSYLSPSTAISRNVVGKNPRKLHKPIPKGILGSFIISGKSLKNMAGDAMDVCLRVLKEAHKNRYDTYSVRKVPCFATVMQLKQYFLQNCKEEIFPATDTTFQIGYYADGNKKFSISSEIQLAEAFSLVKNGMITLWVDPHKDVPRGSSGKKRKGKKHNKPCFARFVAPKVK